MPYHNNLINKLLSIITAGILCFGLISCKNNDFNGKKYNENNSIGVVVTDGAIIRVDPLLYSSVISYINKGEKLVIIDKSKQKEKLNNNNDYWYNVLLSDNSIGWIYGSNLKIFSANKSGTIEKFISDLNNEKIEKLRKKLTGRWEPVEKNSSISDLSLELSDDGTYKSYNKENSVLEGDYILNPEHNEIIFKNGSHIGKNISYSGKNNLYLLKKLTKSSEIKLKKTSSNIDRAGDNAKSDKSTGA